MHHILIIEDDNVIRDSLRRLLERNNYQVSEARTVHDAVSNFDLDALDIIICNLRLPDQPGTKLIRMTPTPVLVLTRYASQRSETDSLQVCAVDYLSLPLDHEQILRSIERALSENLKQKKRACLNLRDRKSVV